MAKVFLAICLSVLIADLSQAGLIRRRLKRSFDRNAASGGCERGSGNGNASGYRLRDGVRRVSHYGDGYYPHPPGSDSPRHENPVNSDNERSEYEDRDSSVRNSEQNDPDDLNNHESDFLPNKPFNNGDLKVYPENGEESQRNGEFERDSTDQNDNDNGYRNQPHDFEDERNRNQEFYHPEPPPPPQRKFRIRRPHRLRFRHPNQFHGGQRQHQQEIGTESDANLNSHPHHESTPNSDNAGPSNNGNTDEATNVGQLTNHNANPVVDEIVHDKTYNIYNQLVEMDQSEPHPLPDSANGHQVNSVKIHGQGQSSNDPVSLLTPDTPAEAMFLYAAAESGFKKYPDMVNQNDGTRSLGLYSGLDLSGLAYGGLHSGYTGFGYGGLIPSATTAYGYGGLLPSASTYGLLGNYYAAGNAYGLALPGFRSIVPY